MPTPAPADITDPDLVLQFESLGDNCELGLVQRRVGAEPLGLLRFAGAPLHHLLRALDARFAGLADPDHVRIQPENGEYMVKLTRYDFIYHADAKIGAVDPAVLHRQQTRILSFLASKLLADLENPTKILVFRQNEPLLASDLVDLRLALDRFGQATLLWVQQAGPGHPAGSVVQVADRFMAGYVSHLAAREDVPSLDVASWLAMLRRAWRLCQSGGALPVSGGPVATGDSAIRLRFGIDGNAQVSTGHGWSAPENGFTWAIGESSLLTLTPPLPAHDYWLEMEVVPFTAPPTVPAQRLAVQVNGEAVQVFDPLVRGHVSCMVPGRLVHGRSKVEILLEHPRAASPHETTGENDSRRLAVAFRSLSLSSAEAMSRVPPCLPI